MGFLNRLHLTLFFSFLFTLAVISPTAESAGFKCSGATKNCTSLVGYVLQNTTTLSAIQTLFGVKHLRSLLEVNSLNLSTSPSTTFRANQTIKIPFPCRCANGTGVSNKIPIYTVVKGNFLYYIASDIFNYLVTDDDIQAANGIPDPSKIVPGQKLWIPLPCSCDEVDDLAVIHYGYVVPGGDTVARIAEAYGTTVQTLLSLNNMSSPSKLLEDQVLDVPLRACASSINTTSLDNPLLVANGSYVLTANDCVQCKCVAANNYTLQCTSSQLKATKWSTCPLTECSLGNTTYTVCSSTSCAYAGYTSQNILTTLETVSSCPAPPPSKVASPPPGNVASKINTEGSNLVLTLAFAHFIILYYQHFW